MKHWVVVTGLGLVTPLGNTVEATWGGLIVYVRQRDRTKATNLKHEMVGFLPPSVSALDREILL